MKPIYVRKRSRKPFKSGLKVNTIKSDTFIHPVTGNLCYEFNEDDSYVEQRMCRILTTEDIALNLINNWLESCDKQEFIEEWKTLNKINQGIKETQECLTLDKLLENVK